MKKLNLTFNILAGLLLLGLVGCASSGSGVKSDLSDRQYERNTVQVDNPSISLTDYLRRVPGVQVNGSGPNAQIKIDGVSSFILTTDPLFVIDEVRVDRSFSQVNGMISVSMVESITVLKRADAAIYGVEGGNGVILINTKKN